MRKRTIEELIETANNIHNFKYKYNFDNYENIKSKVLITCPEHGNFYQILSDHLYGRGCPKCAIIKNANLKRNNLQDLINRANSVHNNKYDYSLWKKYNNMHEEQEIICKKHGTFKLSTHSHINKGRGCKQCAIDNVTDTKEMFVRKANIVHNFKYNYDKSDYITGRKKIIITCLEHGDFVQRPRDHINAKQGCPSCKESKGEMLVAKILQSFNVDFDRQKTFPELKHQRLLQFDFYLTEYNSCIEYDGEQHFRSIKNWGGEESFYEVQFRDLLKNEYCSSNGISLLRLSYKDTDTEVRFKILKFLGINEDFITKFSDFK